MLSEYITSLADVSFHIVAYMYARFRYSGKNPMRFAVFWRISVRFCGFRTPLTPPSVKESFLAVWLTVSFAHLQLRYLRLRCLTCSASVKRAKIWIFADKTPRKSTLNINFVRFGSCCTFSIKKSASGEAFNRPKKALGTTFSLTGRLGF